MDSNSSEKIKDALNQTYDKLNIELPITKEEFTSSFLGIIDELLSEQNDDIIEPDDDSYDSQRQDFVTYRIGNTRINITLDDLIKGIESEIFKSVLGIMMKGFTQDQVDRPDFFEILNLLTPVVKQVLKNLQIIKNDEYCIYCRAIELYKQNKDEYYVKEDFLPNKFLDKDTEECDRQDIPCKHRFCEGELRLCEDNTRQDTRKFCRASEFEFIQSFASLLSKKILVPQENQNNEDNNDAKFRYNF